MTKKQKRIDEIIRRIESYNFECEAGPLECCVDWKNLKVLSLEFAGESDILGEELQETKAAHGQFGMGA